MLIADTSCTPCRSCEAFRLTSAILQLKQVDPLSVATASARCSITGAVTMLDQPVVPHAIHERRGASPQLAILIALQPTWHCLFPIGLHTHHSAPAPPPCCCSCSSCFSRAMCSKTEPKKASSSRQSSMLLASESTAASRLGQMRGSKRARCSSLDACSSSAFAASRPARYLTVADCNPLASLLNVHCAHVRWGQHLQVE